MAARVAESPGQPLSVAALQIVQESLRDTASIASLSRLAEADPAFALRLLSMVNSAAFGSARQVTDVKQAASLLGVRGLRNIGLSLALTDMVPGGAHKSLLLLCCVRRATACRLLAKASGLRELDDYFTTGLFLDVGLLSRARADAAGAAEIVRLPARNRVVFERSLGLLDHAQVGFGLASEFHLSADVALAIEHHHDRTPPNEALARLAWAAERVAAVYEGGEAEQLQEEALSALSLLGISRDQAERLLHEVPALTSSAAQGLGCDKLDEGAISTTLADVNRALAELNQSYEAMVRRLEALVEEKEALAKNLADANAQLERLAMCDPLTGLANRRAVEVALKRDLARADRDGTWLSVIAFDIDHFKRVNDTYGHAAGDEVLQMIGRVLSGSLRAGDLAARVGGEEFLTILPNTDPDGALITAERLRRRIEAERVTSSQSVISVTSSFGVASLQGPGCRGELARIVERADRALYAAKHGGRNRVERAI